MVQYYTSCCSSVLLLRAWNRGIGLETCILFAKEGANVLMADISGPALEKAITKLRQLVPSAHKVEIQVSSLPFVPPLAIATNSFRSATSLKNPM
jgi:NAD(P)-dependent dehydrogenase (short-subunit alcohol dehydrogenase family)